MRYEGTIYRPPSEANAFILQATIGCSWNHCTYCDMYRRKQFRVRPLEETLEDVAEAGRRYGDEIDKVFVADGDALVLDLETWTAVLKALRAQFPRLRRVSAYATARNLLEKTPEELRTLKELGLDLLYIGPESGDDVVLKRIAKGASAKEHAEAARKAHEAGMIFLFTAMFGDLASIGFEGAPGAGRARHARRAYVPHERHAGRVASYLRRRRAGTPVSMPWALMSSSMSGQWTPWPSPMIS